MPLILCTGVDKRLIEMRKLVLEKAGYTVVALRESAVAEACKKHSFDVAVIGQALSPLDKTRIFVLIRQKCRDTKILELSRSRDEVVLANADDYVVIAADVPLNLVQRVDALIAKRAKPAI